LSSAFKPEARKEARNLKSQIANFTSLMICELRFGIRNHAGQPFATEGLLPGALLIATSEFGIKYRSQ